MHNSRQLTLQMYEILKVNMVKVFLYYTVLFTTTKEGWYHIFIIWFIQCSKSSQMRYRISVFLQLTEYKIEKIAKSACKAAGAMHNARTACTCMHSIRQSDVQYMKANAVTRV